MTLYLNQPDLEQLVSMPMALEVVESAWRDRALGLTSEATRSRTQAPEGILNILAAASPPLGYIGFKYYYGTKTGATKHIHLINVKTGHLEAVVEADWLGSMRTGAASGVATRHLAGKQPVTLGQIGSGGQAATQISAVHHAVGVSRVKVFSRTRDKLVAFCKAMAAELGMDVVPAESAEDAIRDADVVNLITRSATPVLKGEWLAPGQHINAAGSNALNRQEIDQQAVERSDIVAVDAHVAAENECGDLAPLVRQGKLAWGDLIEIGEIIAGKAAGRTNDRQISLFESQGMGLLDLYIAVAALKMARERKAGVRLPIAS